MAQHDDTENPEGQNRHAGHILLAEDDVVSQLVAVNMLEQAGYQVDVVADGRAALTALQSTGYDLVLMDCCMPLMDGFAATRAIRSPEFPARNRDVPVIALTALAMPGDREKCMDAGMDDHVDKPVDRNLLIAAVERQLGGAVSEGRAPLPAGGDGNETHTQKAWPPGFMDSLIDKFLEQVPRDAAGLRKALARGDVSELQEISHRLRGSASIIGASTLASRANALEQAGKAGDSARAAKHAQELIEELQKMTD